jgi:RNA polymerase sigma-54 factor
MWAVTLAPRLDLRTSQQLVMTPQLQQAIGLLALSNLEIETAVAEEVARNPLLAFEGVEGSAPAKADLPEDVAGADALIAVGAGEADAPLDVDYGAETFHHDSASDSGGTGGEEGFDFERVPCGPGSLCEHLMSQAALSFAGADLVIARALIDAVEETGYLATPLREIADGIGAPLAHVERVLDVLQGFDPPGVAARTLAECLALQARAADRYDPAMARLLANLELLARGDLKALKRICGVDDEDLRDMIAEVRSYDPKPGCRFDPGGDARTLVPDLLVARTRDGWAVELNAATLPRLIVDRRYHARLEAGGKASRAFAAECMAGANWLMKALDSRAQTILKVGTELVRHQEGFFAHGAAGLKPLTLSRVADAVGVHETTVGRVASNKSLACARGLFPLKYFFTSGVGAADGGEASAEAVKSRIRALIAAERPDAVLSDDTLVDLLRAEGVAIARRTVAKYREACGLGSSVQRRRHAALGH